MKEWILGSAVRPWIRTFGVAVLLLAPWQLGCPSASPPDNGNGGGDGTPDEIEAEIVSPTSSFGVSSLDAPVSVLYSISSPAMNIRGIRIPVVDISLGSPAIGDPVTIATDLPTGENRFFSFDPEEAGTGFFRVGIVYEDSGDDVTVESEAVIHVEGAPNPVFVQPVNEDTVFEQGDPVFVSFDCQDPEGEVDWRLFLLDAADSLENPADQLGTELAVGTGNAGTFNLDTGSLLPGNYRLGVSATDSGSTIAQTVANGESRRIVTIPNNDVGSRNIQVIPFEEPVPPSIAFTAPGSSDVSVFRDDPYTIQFGVSESDPDAEIEIFYDADTDPGNGFTIIEDGLPVTATAVALPTGIPEGTYHIGGTIRTEEESDTRYAVGRIIIVRTVTLDVTRPDSTLSVAPSASVQILWTTNAPATAGTVDVIAQTVNSSGAPFGPEIAILTRAAMTSRSTAFSSATPGLFEITVRLNLRDGTAVTDKAPARVRVSSLPGIFWLGSVVDATATGGAVFEGVNFEDNAGTSFAAVGDYDDDGRDDFVIGSRYGKPFFLNPDGIGPGEAYLIYGGTGSERLEGTYNLNSLGTELLRGVTLTGVRTASNSSDTDGLADINALPDVDGDDKRELAFGFPRTNSANLRNVAGTGAGALELEGQFLNGGLVILSSSNSILEDPDTGSPVLNLDLVGRRFSNQSVTPGTPASALRDSFRFQAGNPGGNPPTADACVAQTDGVFDTIVGPSIGFTSILAPPLWEQLGFVPIPEGTAPANQRCVTQFALAACSIGGVNPFFELDSGSGFYPSTATPLEPRGARIIGWEEDDRFGTSVTVSSPLGESQPSNLIVSAPGRSALASEIGGVETDLSGAGIAYLSLHDSLWGPDTITGTSQVPPTPHQYVIGQVSHCGDNRQGAVGATRVAGDSNDHIENVLGIDDFNRDGRADIAVGSPTANGGQGRVYVAYRRQPGTIGGLEGDFVLNKLRLDPSNPERLDGMLIVSDTVDGMGASLATGFDFNGDNISDLVIGSPNANGGAGEIIVVFGGTSVVSPVNGITVANLLANSRTAMGGPVAVRIKGNALDTDGLFGFNVANAGDLNGDGKDELLVAAPNSSPRFDPNPNDSTDALTDLGIDRNFDGVRDTVPGDDELRQAGQVYVIFGSNRLDQMKTCQDSETLCTTSADCPTGKTCGTATFTTNVSQLGKQPLRGFIIAGRRAGDRIGGGDAGDSAQGGINAKANRGRSRGLAAAGDVDGDGRDDFLIGSILADPRRDPNSSVGVQNGGEAYLVYGAVVP